MELTVAPTRRDDIIGLSAVLEQTGLFPSEMLVELLEPVLAGQSRALWLSARLDGVAVGLCYCVPEELADRTWNMLALAVRPDLQGRGIGAALVGTAEAHLRGDRQRLMVVDTSGTGPFMATRDFYAARGYEEVARIRDFWAEGDDKITFRKAL